MLKRIFQLTSIEQSYRDTSISSRKYLKRLTDFVSDLVERRRYLEANYFFSQLCEVSPNHKLTIRLGYTIAIATFDNDSVLKYDKLLTDSTSDSCELLWFRLRYYQSRNDISACEVLCCHLLKKRLISEYLPIIIEICLERNNYIIAEALAQHLAETQKALSPLNSNGMKKIVITRFVENLRKRQ